LVINADRTLTNIEQLKNSIEQIWLSNGISGIKFTLVVDSDIDQITAKDLVWWALANFDADRDLTFTINDVLIIDARRKTNGLNGTLRRWPNPTTADRNTIARIDQIWDKLNLGELIKSPSEYYQKFAHGTGSDSE
jgi:3-polyprenyl-4-hydroxybenzoate decarboxylase